MANQLEDEVRHLNKRLDQLSQLIEKQARKSANALSGNGLQDKACELGKKLRSMADDFVSTSEEKLGQFSGTAQDTYDQIKCNANDAYDQIKCNAQDGAKMLKEGVEKNPLISLGISALVGYVIALLFCRRS